MQLRATLFVALGPLVTFGQAPAPVAPVIPAQILQTPVAAGAPVIPGQVAPVVQPTIAPFYGTTPAQSSQWQQEGLSVEVDGLKPGHCPVVPLMPQKFYAKRKFATFFNVIEFYDDKGQSFGYVENWFADWKNLLGFSGASFYLKVDSDIGRQGVFNMNPKPGLTQQFGDASATPNPTTLEGIEAVQQKEWHERVRESARGMVTNKAAFLSDYFNGNHALSAEMHGEHNGKYFVKTKIGDWKIKISAGEPFKDKMKINDCHGHKVFQAEMREETNGIDTNGIGEIEYEGAVDSHYYTNERNVENELIIQNLGLPPVVAVRLYQKEPCSPFPPFCSQMGMWNWFIHGSEWEGDITQPGYNQSMGAGLFTIQMTSGAATDMRFLALYSAYQFSNTRFSPLVNIVLRLFLLAFCVCCGRCCCATAAYAQRETKVAEEETQKLLGTAEASAQQARDRVQPENKSFFTRFTG